jgi:hypothetical protein
MTFCITVMFLRHETKIGKNAEHESRIKL